MAGQHMHVRAVITRGRPRLCARRPTHVQLSACTLAPLSQEAAERSSAEQLALLLRGARAGRSRCVCPDSAAWAVRERLLVETMADCVHLGWIERAVCAARRADTPVTLDYKVMEGSLYNTPPCWSIYICGLVFKHLLAAGGLQGVQANNDAKAKLVGHRL